MKIAIVSSHYPPNFVSGGTLIPQRITQGLAARGHTVQVFAGAIATDQPSLWHWRGTGPDGVPVHWTEITEMVDWASDLNHTNPRLDAVFVDFLGEFSPDVVHFHNLQGFGGGLVSLAKASGAAVVITMHDMWWWCARQFLADRSLRPCSPVVSCGVCDCERDNDWLIRRDGALSGHLAHADLVLAPSSTMRRLLEANGVDPDRLAVDENPAAGHQPPTQRTPVADGVVRFVYAGGPHPLKGSAVALRAAALLAGVQGWRMDVYGMDLPAKHQRQLTALPPYRPDMVREVLSGYDVLLMPSVATESFSLITREALDTGLVVITGDNPGPTEVVRDGENGLVVPRGDADAMAAAMRSLIDDRALLERLRPEPGHIVLRSLDEQLDGLEEHYRRLLTASQPSTSTGARPSINTSKSASPIRRVLLMAGIDGAPLRYRARLPQEALAALGVRMDVRPFRDVDVPGLARTADAVVLYRVPATEQVLDVIDMVRRRPEPVPVLFDVDDLIFDPDVEPELRPVLAHLPQQVREEYWRGVRRYRTTLEACDAYIGSTEMLCRQVTELTSIPSHRFANGIGIQLARACDAYLRIPRTPGPVRIGYLSGTNTHNKDWEHIEPAVIQVMRSRPEIELWLGGLLEPTSALAEMSNRVRRTPLLPWYELPRALRDLDVNLAPLAPGGRFNEAKSAIKWLEAALVGTPTVASPTQPFRESLDNGHTGFLADSSAEWVSAVTRLVDDPVLRDLMGDSARNHALLTWSPGRQGRRYLQIMQDVRQDVADNGHRELFTAWTPEYDSYPFEPLQAEPYGPIPLPGRPVHGASGRSVRRIAADYRTNAWNHLRANGVLPTARKTVQVARRLPPRALARLRMR